MSAGVVHKKASLILASAFSVVSIFHPQYFECAVGAMVGILITPDLDVDAGNISTTIIKQKTGWIGAKIWDTFWHPYRKSFKHGSFASHFPIFSTLARLFYIYFLLVFPMELLVLVCISIEPNYNLDLIYDLKWWGILFLRPMFFYGLAASDFIHWMLDISTTEHKGQ